VEEAEEDGDDNDGGGEGGSGKGDDGGDGQGKRSSGKIGSGKSGGGGGGGRKAHPGCTSGKKNCYCRSGRSRAVFKVDAEGQVGEAVGREWKEARRGKGSEVV
jgi:hypothetical protein